MRLIMVAQLESFEDEAVAVISLFDAGLKILHLHKPGASYGDIGKLPRRLPAEYMERIATYDHFGPTSEWSLKGVHLNRCNPAAPAGFTGHVSHSCHSLEKVVEYKAACSHTLLNPIYNSISEEGYAVAYAFDDLQKAYQAGIIDSGVMALGGATVERSPGINSLGPGGMGLLGDIQQRTGTDFINYFRESLRLASAF